MKQLLYVNLLITSIVSSIGLYSVLDANKRLIQQIRIDFAGHVQIKTIISKSVKKIGKTNNTK